MKKINQLKIFFIVVAVFALIATIGFTMQSNRNTIIGRTINDGVSLVQGVHVSFTQRISSFFRDTANLFDTFEENRRLRERMYNYETLRVETEILRNENESLKEMLDIVDTLTNFNTMQATTIGRNIDHWHNFMTVNRGRIHGARVDMAVVSREGYLIGKVTDVGELQSRVQLLTQYNPTVRAHAFVLGMPESMGQLTGYDPRTGEIVMVQVAKDVEIEIGERVVTSGLGETYPTGLLVGYVARTEISSDGLTQTLFIENNMNYNNLDFVFLVSREAIVPDMEVSETTDD